MKHILLFFSALYFSCLIASAQPLTAKKRMLLTEMTNKITSNSYPGIHSVLVLKGNKELYAQYFNGFTADSLHDSRSSFKSVASLLIGIAIDKGFIKDVNQKVYDFFPEYKPFNNWDTRKSEMTIKDLLEMKSGFDCEEFNDNKDCENAMSESNDWVKFSLNLPMKVAPGHLWAYTSVNPMIISGIISKAAKMSVLEFSKKYLFDPLKISKYKWTVDPAGHAMTAGSFYILPSDMLKLGKLVRDKGLWNGKRVISASWIKESTAALTPIPYFSYMQISKSTVGIPRPSYYGYYWYREQLKTKHFQEEMLFASGNGGQYIFIIDRLKLVVVFTQGNYNTWRAKQAFDLMVKYIVPAVL